MRIYATGNAAYAAPASAPRRAPRNAFSVGGDEPADAPRAASAPRAAVSLDSLMAIQAFEDPAERRRRSLKHGNRLLDVLDELKLGVLAGTLDQNALGRLQALSEQLKESSGDPRLDGVIAEIALRAAVELAKFTRR